VISEQLANRDSSSYCGLWGLTAQVQGTSVSRLTQADGQPLPPDRLLVAFNSFTAAGAGGRFPLLREIVRRPEAQLRDTGRNSRDAVRSYLQQKVLPPLTPRRWLSRQTGRPAP